MSYRPTRRAWVIAAIVPALLSAFLFVTAASAADVNATIQGFRYVPSPLVVNPGDNVIWENKDTQAHTITSKTPGLFDAPIAGSGAKATIKAPTTNGLYDIICTLHPNMAGQLRVGPAAPATGTGLAPVDGGVNMNLIALGLGALLLSGAAAYKARRG